MKIFAKLFLLLAAVAGIPLAVTAAIVLKQSGNLQTELLQKNREIGGDILRASGAALEKEARSTHLNIVLEKTSRLSNFFDNIAGSVLLEAQLATQALTSAPDPDAPPAFRAEEIAERRKDKTYEATLHGKKPYVSWWARPGADVADQVARLRSLGQLFVHNQKMLPGCQSTYLGLESGLILGFPGGKKVYTDTFDPRSRPWYTGGKTATGLFWSDLYEDSTKGEDVITCAKAIPDGVVAIDVVVTDLRKELFDTRKLAVQGAVLIDPRGTVRISQPPDFKFLPGGPFSRAFALWSASKESDVLMDADNLYAFGTINFDSTKRWFYSVRLSSESILAPIREVRERNDASVQALSQSIESQVRTLGLQILVGSVVVLLLIMALAWRLAKSATRPLIQMSEVAHRIGKGELDQQVDVRSADEFGQMGRSINEMIKGLKERDFVKSTFKMYVAASVVEQLIKDPERLKLGGEKRELTVFFSDLANFTTLAEKMTPEALVGLVNEYLGAMTDAIWKHEGTIDKYGGDSIMAFWGAPIAQADHAARACRAALSNLEGLRRLWPDWERRGLPRLEMRIGINTGEMIVGNMGSTVKRDYTVLGDSVNLGSRLEGANKEYGTNIIISEATRRAAGNEIQARELDLLAVKGKSEAVRIYELVPTRTPAHDAFEAGLAAYREKKWDEAEAAFKKSPEDPPSIVFLQRIAVMRGAPPPPDWGGTFVMKRK